MLSRQIVLFFFYFFTNQALAKNEDIRKIISEKIDRPVDSVREFQGKFEVVSDGKIYYVDHDFNFLFAGSIFDLKRKINITAERMKEVNIINFNELPFDHALKFIHGDGSRIIALFSDPNCIYCKKLEQEILQIENITIYIFLYGVLTEDSQVLARNIWCNKNPTETWKKWMIETKRPSEANCISPNEKILTLGKKLHIRGTPTIFFQNGQRLVGMQNLDNIKRKLSLENNVDFQEN